MNSEISCGRCREKLAELAAGLLAPDDRDDLERHLATCSDCRRELAHWQALGDVMLARVQHVPPDVGAHAGWARIEAALPGAAAEHPIHHPKGAIAMISNEPRPLSTAGGDAHASQQEERAATMPSRPRGRGNRGLRHALGSLGAVAAAALLVVAYVQLVQLRAPLISVPKAAATHSPTPLPTIKLAPPPTPGTPPDWHTYNLPPKSDGQNGGIISIAVAPSDGNTAYLCNAEAVPGTIQIYQTADHAASWQLIGQLSPAGVAHLSDCQLAVDAYDPTHVVASVATGQHQSSAQPTFVSYLSTDSGAHWTLLGQERIAQPATVNGVTYAIHETADGGTHLSASRDGMKTWQPIDESLLAATVKGREVVNFWVRPDGSSLLAEAGAIPAPNTVQLPQWLWESSDGGTHWSPLATPDGAATFSVRQPRAGEPWSICGLSALSTPSGPRNLWCTTDGGHRWALQPGFTVPGECTGTSCLIPLMLSDVSVLQLADNGDILLCAWTGILRVGATERLTGIGLYRLPAGSDRWQFLGPLDTSLFYVSSPGYGTLWRYVGNSFADSRLAGSIGSRTGEPNPLIGKVMVAPYNP